MPFRGVQNGEIVAPAETADREAVECTECNGQMYPREGENIARHFYHVEEEKAENCSTTGESAIHNRCKALALASLKQEWEHQSERFGIEIPVDVSFTPTEPNWRIADALIEFEQRNPFFGTGLIIEIQHRNRGKDLQRTTYDYISADHSVAWLEPSDFEEEHLDYNLVDQRFAAYHPTQGGANSKYTHHWQADQPLKAGYAISIRSRTPDTLGPPPDTLEDYRSYPNPRTNIPEDRWSFMKTPWH